MVSTISGYFVFNNFEHDYFFCQHVHIIVLYLFRPESGFKPLLTNVE